MRPLHVLNAIVFGSAVAITFSLVGVLIIFLALKGEHAQMGVELPALLRSSALFGSLAVVSGASLYGLLKTLRWRWLAHGAMWLTVASIVLLYWPE